VSVLVLFIDVLFFYNKFFFGGGDMNRMTIYHQVRDGESYVDQLGVGESCSHALIAKTVQEFQQAMKIYGGEWNRKRGQFDQINAMFSERYPTPRNWYTIVFNKKKNAADSGGSVVVVGKRRAEGKTIAAIEFANEGKKRRSIMMMELDGGGENASEARSAAEVVVVEMPIPLEVEKMKYDSVGIAADDMGTILDMPSVDVLPWNPSSVSKIFWCLYVFFFFS